jgi:hypothetical protein
MRRISLFTLALLFNSGIKHRCGTKTLKDYWRSPLKRSRDRRYLEGAIALGARIKRHRTILIYGAHVPSLALFLGGSDQRASHSHFAPPLKTASFKATAA